MDSKLLVLVVTVTCFQLAETCPSSYIPAEAACYKVLSGIRTFDEAQEACQLDDPNAHLPTFPNSTVYDGFVSFVVNQGLTSNTVFLDGRDDLNDGIWLVEDHTTGGRCEMPYTRWDATTTLLWPLPITLQQPDNNEPDDYCILKYSGYTGMSDGKCNKSNATVCQVPSFRLCSSTSFVFTSTTTSKTVNPSNKYLFKNDKTPTSIANSFRIATTNTIPFTNLSTMVLKTTTSSATSHRKATTTNASNSTWSTDATIATTSTVVSSSMAVTRSTSATTSSTLATRTTSTTISLSTVTTISSSTTYSALTATTAFISSMISTLFQAMKTTTVLYTTQTEKGTSAKPTPINYDCLSGWTKAGDACYKKVFTYAATYDDAAALCVKEHPGAVLSILRDDADFNEFNNLMKTWVWHKQLVYLNGKKNPENGKWIVSDPGGASCSASFVKSDDVVANNGSCLVSSNTNESMSYLPCDTTGKAAYKLVCQLPSYRLCSSPECEVGWTYLDSFCYRIFLGDNYKKYRDVRDSCSSLDAIVPEFCTKQQAVNFWDFISMGKKVWVGARSDNELESRTLADFYWVNGICGFSEITVNLYQDKIPLNATCAILWDKYSILNDEHCEHPWASGMYYYTACQKLPIEYTTITALSTSAATSSIYFSTARSTNSIISTRNRTENETLQSAETSTTTKSYSSSTGAKLSTAASDGFEVTFITSIVGTSKIILDTTIITSINSDTTSKKAIGTSHLFTSQSSNKIPTITSTLNRMTFTIINIKSNSISLFETNTQTIGITFVTQSVVKFRSIPSSTQTNSLAQLVTTSTVLNSSTRLLTTVNIAFAKSVSTYESGSAFSSIFVDTIETNMGASTVRNQDSSVVFSTVEASTLSTSTTVDITAMAATGDLPILIHTTGIIINILTTKQSFTITTPKTSKNMHSSETSSEVSASSPYSALSTSTNVQTVIFTTTALFNNVLTRLASTGMIFQASKIFEIGKTTTKEGAYQTNNTVLMTAKTQTRSKTPYSALYDQITMPSSTDQTTKSFENINTGTSKISKTSSSFSIAKNTTPTLPGFFAPSTIVPSFSTSAAVIATSTIATFSTSSTEAAFSTTYLAVNDITVDVSFSETSAVAATVINSVSGNTINTLKKTVMKTVPKYYETTTKLDSLVTLLRTVKSPDTTFTTTTFAGHSLVSHIVTTVIPNISASSTAVATANTITNIFSCTTVDTSTSTTAKDQAIHSFTIVDKTRKAVANKITPTSIKATSVIAITIVITLNTALNAKHDVESLVTTVAIETYGRSTQSILMPTTTTLENDNIETTFINQDATSTASITAITRLQATTATTLQSTMLESTSNHKLTNTTLHTTSTILVQTTSLTAKGLECNFDPARVPFTKNDKSCVITPNSKMFESNSKHGSSSIASYVFMRLPSPHKGIAAVIKKVASSLGCTWLIGILSFTIIAFSFLRVWTLERILQMNLEISLLLAHIVLFATRDVNDLKLCRVAIGLLHYFFMVNGVFFLMESLHLFSVIANIISKRELASRLMLTIAGWVLPAIVTAASIPFIRDSPSSYSCWFHFGDHGAIAVMGSAILLPPILGLVVAETANMNIVSRSVALGSEVRKKSALIANGGNMLLITFSLLDWFIGAYTLYTSSMGLYLFAFVGNIVQGVMYFMFHAMGNAKVRRFISKLLASCRLMKPEN